MAGAWPDGSIGEAHYPETHLVPRILTAMARGRNEFEIYGNDYPTPDGTCMRDYIHVSDLANAHRLGLEWLEGGGQGGVFNLGNGLGFSNLEILSACAEVTGIKLNVRFGPRRPGDPAMLVASSARAQQALSWTPQRGALSDIIGDAWRWHRSHPEGYDTGRCV